LGPGGRLGKVSREKKARRQEIGPELREKKSPYTSDRAPATGRKKKVGKVCAGDKVSQCAAGDLVKSQKKGRISSSRGQVGGKER